MYRIDLKTILRILAHQSGKLDTTLDYIPGFRERCRAQLLLVEGNVVSCSIEGRDRNLLSGHEALRVLQDMGVLKWTYTPTPQSNPSPHVALLEAPSSRQVPEIHPLSFPTRIRLVEQQEFTSWPRLQRSIYNLADGSKSVEALVRVLSQPYERIVEALSALRIKGVIDLHRNSHR